MHIYDGMTVNNTPTWSPDGKFLVFAGSRVNSISRLEKIDAESGALQDLTPAGFDYVGFMNNWLPDGRLIFGGNKGGKWGLYLLDPKSGANQPALKNPPDGDLTYMMISPSGKKAAYIIQEVGGKLPCGMSLYMDNLENNDRKLLFSAGNLYELYPIGWNYAEDHLIIFDHTKDGQIQNYLIDLITNHSMLLDGSPPSLNRSTPNSPLASWVNDTEFILKTNNGVFATDVNGKQAQEFCTTKAGEFCTFWIKDSP